MLRIALRSLRTRLLRAILIGVAVTLGTAMISGTYILTDQITGAFDTIFEKANEGTDVILGRREAFDTQQTQVGPIDQALVETVRGVEGVAAAEGLVQDLGVPVIKGKPLTTQGAPAFVFSTPSERFQSSKIVAGRFPTARGEMAIEIGIADREKLAIGNSIGIQTRTGLKTVTVVGTFRFGDANGIGGAILTSVTLEDAQEWFNRKGQVNSIVVAAAPGVSAAGLQRRISAVVPNDVIVETGQENATRQATDINDDLGFLKIFLFIFAGVAILVGAFIIFNIFSITVAQRIRELAMLRTIGASRGQLLRSVITEAAVIGVVASLVGIAVGVLFAKGLSALFEASGSGGLPTAGISLAPRTIIVPLLIGSLTTILAALLPALRATRIPPVAALREGAVLPTPRLSRYTPLFGGIALLLGIGTIIAGFRSDGALSSRLSLIGFGALLVIIGVSMIGRLLIRPLARAVGWPLQKVFGNSARLGRANTMRDPSRTASTAAALMIGVALVAFIAVFVDAFKSSFFTALDRTIQADLVVVNDSFLPLPAGVAVSAQTASGSPTAIGIGFAEVEVAGQRKTANAIDPIAARQIVRFDWESGDDSVLDRLDERSALIERSFAQDLSVAVGDNFEVTSVDGANATYRVLGVYRDPQLFTGFTVSDVGFRRINPDKDVGVLLIDYPDGTSPEQAKDSATDVLSRTFPSATVRTRAEYREFVGSQVNQFLGILYSLLALSVLISVIGVIITLLLAVYERTREIGMMRAIGSSRRQIRSMIRFESIITCVIGGIIGLVVGLFLGWLMVRALREEGLSFTVPAGTLITVLILAAVAGLLASLFPARRAARLQPLDALHYE